MSNKVKGYLKQLLIIGIISGVIGLTTAIITCISTAEISLTYLPISIVSGLIGYIGVIRLDPGGRVNFYVRYHKRTKDEQELYDLIVKYRSTKLINLVSFSFLIIITILQLNRHATQNIFNLDNIVGLSVFSFVSVISLAIGAKYISAWWNIKKNIGTELKNNLS